MEFTHLPSFTFVEGSHNAYPGLSIKRSIFFAKTIPNYWIISDKITGSGTHTFDQYFHLAPMYKLHTNLNLLTHSVTTPYFGLYPSDTTASAKIIVGWGLDKYNRKEEDPVVKFSKTGKPPVTFETVLFLYTSEIFSVNVPKEQVFNGNDLVDSTDAFCIKINYGNNNDWFFKSDSDTLLLNYGSFSSRSKLAFVKVIDDSSVANFQLILGSELYYNNKSLIDSWK